MVLQKTDLNIEHWSKVPKTKLTKTDVSGKEFYNPQSNIEKYLRAVCDYTLPSGFTLAGSVEQKIKKNYRDSCGTFQGFHVCDIHDHVKVKLESCNMLICPTCVRTAAAVKGFKVAYEKVQPFQLLLSKNNLRTLPNHVIFSPPKENTPEWHELSKELQSLSTKPVDYADYMKKIHTFERFALRYGHSVITVYHPDRINDLGMRYFSPHFHTILWIKGNTSMMPSDVYHKTGIFVKNKGVLHTLKDVKRLFTYVISHTWIHRFTTVREREQTEDEKQDYKWRYMTVHGKFPSTFSKITEIANYSHQCYFYAGLISPYNLRKNGLAELRFEPVACDEPLGKDENGHWVHCEGIMCECNGGIHVLDTLTGNLYTPAKLQHFGLKITFDILDRFVWFIKGKIERGYYLFTKYILQQLEFRGGLDVQKFLH